MKLYCIFFILLFAVNTSSAGESRLTTTFQPLDGLGSGEIHIRPVTCHDWYSHSGQFTAIELISAPNVPPTNNPKEATENLNLASVCGVRFGYADPDANTEIILNATAFSVPERFDHAREQIIKACLECLRLTLPQKFRRLPVVLKSKDSDREWLTEIVREFNKSERGKPFFVSASDTPD